MDKKLQKGNDEGQNSECGALAYAILVKFSHLRNHYSTRSCAVRRVCLSWQHIHKSQQLILWPLSSLFQLLRYLRARKKEKQTVCISTEQYLRTPDEAHFSHSSPYGWDGILSIRFCLQSSTTSAVPIILLRNLDLGHADSPIQEVNCRNRYLLPIKLAVPTAANALLQQEMVEVVREDIISKRAQMVVCFRSWGTSDRLIKSHSFLQGIGL